MWDVPLLWHEPELMAWPTELTLENKLVDRKELEFSVLQGPKMGFLLEQVKACR